MLWRLCKSTLVLLLLSHSSGVIDLLKGQQKPRDVVIESNRQELDNLLLRKPILTTADRSARLAVLKQINEDFRSMQVLNNQVLTEVTSEAVIDYKSVANKIGQIGGKANRLKANMLLPKPLDLGKNSSVVSSAAELKNALLEFDRVVMSFAHNPIFQQTNVMDIEPAKQASNDLELIIKQSQKLKRAAEKLAKKNPYGRG